MFPHIFSKSLIATLINRFSSIWAIRLCRRAMQGFRPSPFRSLYKYGSWAPKDSLAPLLSLLHLFPPNHPLSLWLQYIFLPHGAFFKLQSLWTWNAGQSLVLSWSWTMRSLFDIISTRERNSSKFSLHDRYAPYGSIWYLNSTEQRCSFDFSTFLIVICQFLVNLPYILTLIVKNTEDFSYLCICSYGVACRDTLWA